MAETAMPAAAGFRVGSIFNRARKLLGANVVTFFAVMLVAALPNMLLAQLIRFPRSPFGLQIFGRSLLTSIVSSTFNTIALAAITYLAFRELHGQSPRAVAPRRRLIVLGSAIALALLLSLAIDVGVVLLVIPGLVLAARWCAAVPACVVEALGPFAAMRRSVQLTKGYRRKIVGILLVFGGVRWVVGFLLGLLPLWAGRYASLAAGLVWGAAWGAYWNAALVMIYHDLRMAKEAVDPQEVAAVFD
jgi:hypothetical protein